ncbi:MAG: zinc transporter ZupT [Planctomycetota bacterium]|jgi:zinc transporter ZupT|uniref:ZIP family metal transporter n=1 Tax=Patiriisocius sp. Uisw_047 TaxID=3230969 RepID=UPI0039E7FBF8
MKYAVLIIAVLLGYIVASVFTKNKVKHISLYLAFSGAFLLSVTLFELLPEVFENLEGNPGLYIMGGILIQIGLEYFSRGAEHGHVHLSTDKRAFPLVLLISLSIHALIEGFPISHANNLLWGIVIHKIPVAIVLSFFFIKAKYSKTTTLIFLTIFAAMTPLGTLLMDVSPMLYTYQFEIAAIAIGIFLHVSTTILFESSKDHSFNLSKVLVILFAVVLAYFL